MHFIKQSSACPLLLCPVGSVNWGQAVILRPILSVWVLLPAERDTPRTRWETLHLHVSAKTLFIVTDIKVYYWMCLITSFCAVSVLWTWNGTRLNVCSCKPLTCWHLALLYFYLTLCSWSGEVKAQKKLCLRSEISISGLNSQFHLKNTLAAWYCQQKWCPLSGSILVSRLAANWPSCLV